MAPSFSQAPAAQGLPSDPRAVFAAAAPFYDFNNAQLKPWHLKATYQLYDDSGKPGEQGTYEYWWASPQVYRSSWTRPGASHTDWHTADGKHSFQATGAGLSYFEDELQSKLLSPLPKANRLDPAKFSLFDQSINLNGTKVPCYMFLPAGRGDALAHPIYRGQFDTYCFSTEMPVVLGIYSHATLLIKFSDFVRIQGRALPREVDFRDGKRNVLAAEVDSINGLNPSDAALTPGAEATLVTSEVVTDSPDVILGKQIKRKPIEFPKAEANGHVCMQVIIGTDGRAHNPRVITATSPAFAAAELKALAQLEYQPSMLHGVPVAVQEEFEIDVTVDSTN